MLEIGGRTRPCILCFRFTRFMRGMKYQDSGGQIPRFDTLQYDIQKTPCLEYASELYRPSHRRLSAKLVPTFVDGGCHVVSMTDHYDRILDFIDWSR
jgi:hypothetical protein